MLDKLLNKIFYLLLARHLHVKVRGSFLITEMPLTDYSRTVFLKHGLNTVSDVVLSSIDGVKLSGIGKGTYKEFFALVTSKELI